MGEAKRRLAAARTIYHHTSTLRTNQLWMAGRILPEGQMPAALHPHLGLLQTDARFRRAMVDFPPMVWLTTRVDVPRCLLASEAVFRDDAGQETRVALDSDAINAIALNRMALGFDPADIAATPWKDHAGFGTDEGRALNETAIEAGDDPLDWWVSEGPVDLMAITEMRTSRSIRNPKLTINETYLGEVKRMVMLCREEPAAYIPPTWLDPAEVRLLAKKLGYRAL